MSGRPQAAPQSGVALVTALLVVALGTFLASTVLRSLMLDLRRTGQGIAMEQAYQYARGLEAWAGAILAEDYRLTGAIDHRAEPWAKGIPFIDVPGGRITGRLEDLDGRFNLNNLVIDGQRRERQVAIFRRLLATLGLDPGIAEAAADWIDGDVMPGRRGAEDNSYLRRDPPYRAANRPFAHVSELRSVAGMSEDGWRRLEPYVTALPVSGEPNRINVNSAEPPVLAALHDRISLDLAETIAAGGRGRFESIDQFLDNQRLELIETGELLPLLSVESRFFRADGLIELGDVTHRYHALLERNRSGARVLRRSRGAY